METPLTAPCVYCGNDRPIEAELCPTCGRGWIDKRVEAERRQTDPDVGSSPGAETPPATESAPTTGASAGDVARAPAGAVGATGAAPIPGQLGFDVANETLQFGTAGAEAATDDLDADLPRDTDGAAGPARSRGEGMERRTPDGVDVADEPDAEDDELVAAAAGIAAAMRVGDENGMADEDATGGDDLVAAAAGIAAAMRRTDDEAAEVTDAAATEEVAVSRTGAADTVSGVGEEIEPAAEVASVTRDDEQPSSPEDDAPGPEAPAGGVTPDRSEAPEPIEAEQARIEDETTDVPAEPLPDDQAGIAGAPAIDEPSDQPAGVEQQEAVDEVSDAAAHIDQGLVDEAPVDEAPVAVEDEPRGEPALGGAAAGVVQQQPPGEVPAGAPSGRPDLAAYDLSPLPLEEPRSRRVQTLVVVGVVLAVVATWFVVLAFITRNDGGDIAAQPPGATLPTETTPTGDGSAAPGTTDSPTTITSAPTTTVAPSTTATTLPATTIPQLEAVGEPLAASELSLGGFALGPFNFGSAEALGRLVATYGQPDAFESASVAWGTCEGDEGFVVTWGPLSAVFLGTTDASEFVAYRLGSSPEHPAAGLTTLSGLSVGDTVADLELIYRRFSVDYEDLDETPSFILTRDTDNATLLWGPVTATEGDGVVEGIYSPRPCDGGPEPS